MYYNQAISISIIYCHNFDQPNTPSQYSVLWRVHYTTSVDKQIIYYLHHGLQQIASKFSVKVLIY